MEVNWFWFTLLTASLGYPLAGVVRRRIEGAPRNPYWYLLDLETALLVIVWLPIATAGAFGIGGKAYLVLLLSTVVICIAWALMAELLS